MSITYQDLLDERTEHLDSLIRSEQAFDIDSAENLLEDMDFELPTHNYVLLNILNDDEFLLHRRIDFDAENLLDAIRLTIDNSLRADLHVHIQELDFDELKEEYENEQERSPTP